MECNNLPFIYIYHWISIERYGPTTKKNIHVHSFFIIIESLKKLYNQKIISLLQYIDKLINIYQRLEIFIIQIQLK